MRKLFLFFAIIFMAINTCYAQKEPVSESKKNILTNKSFYDSSSIANIKKGAVSALILNGRFDELEKIYSDANSKFNDDVSYEAHLLKGYEVFSSIGAENYEGFLSIFNAWVSVKKSSISYAARGHYISGQAYRVRGTNYIKSTPSTNLEIAKKLWTSSLTDLKKSIEIDNTLIPSYNRIMVISMSTGDRTSAQEAMSKALVVKPYLFYMRSNYIDYLQPEWGSSYREAEEFIKDSQKHGVENPKIWSLRGNVPSMQAYRHLLTEEYSLALSKYSEALKYGDRPIFLRGKAYSQYMLLDYKGSISSMTKVSNYLNGEDKEYVLRTINKIKTSGSKKNALRTADSLNNKNEVHDLLDWNDFQ